MIFFYVGLGIAMMTTVVSIFETTTNIYKNQYSNKSKAKNTDKIIFQKQNDKKFLQLLNDLKGTSIGTGDLICENIKNGFVDQLNSNYSIISNYSSLNTYNKGISSYSTNSRLVNGCNLVNGFHRVVITPSTIENNTYNLYSCIIDIDPKCTFELVD